MTVYRKIIDLMGLQPTHQNQYGRWYMLLAALDAMESAHPTPDTHSNPWRECLYRLRAFEGTHAYLALAQEFGTRVW